MPVWYEVHSTAKRAFVVIGFGLLLAGLFVAADRLTAPAGTVAASTAGTPDSAAFIAPVLRLRVDDATRETNWSAALSAAMNGKTEVPVANGRIDVLTDAYAIEVDRMEKWHEGIGQASHYGTATGKVACVALIIDSDKWPLNEATIAKLRTVEQTALSRGVKLLLLRRTAPDS